MSKSKATATATASSGGIGFVGLLTIVFIVLKILGYIEWSWVWVLSPLWISAGLTVGIIILALIVVGITKAVMNRR